MTAASRQKISKSRFNRIGRFYLLALSGIAAIIVISQVLIQMHISKQQNDSAVINIAGRQRMLSQSISKQVLQLAASNSREETKELVAKLTVMVDQWEKAHQVLLEGDTTLGIEQHVNSDSIDGMFDVIEEPFNSMLANARSITQILTENPMAQSEVMPYARLVLSNEGKFLVGMDQIVYQYQQEAEAKISRLQKIELILFLVALTIIVLEFLLIFRPMASKIKATVAHLVESEEQAKSMTKEINKLYRQLGKSYQDLEAVNLEPEDPNILLKLKIDGTLTYKSRLFQNLVEEEGESVENFSCWLKKEGYSEDFLDNMLVLLKKGETWNGQLKITNAMGDFSWLNTDMVPLYHESGEVSELVMVATDITQEKEARMRSREINREEIEKKVKEHRYRSELILEGQEEERNRISREMHDGVGQILTALKMNIESMVPSSSIHTRRRLEESKILLKNLIGEVRRISFNLRPSSLSDFGIVPAVKKFTTEISVLSGIEIEFINKTGFINRLDALVENNLYRIIQESINNAIKYGKPEKIKVIFEHRFEQLHITIEDNGTGFDLQEFEQSGHFELSGHGIFNMRERAAFINSQLSINSKIGEGTRISLVVPIKS